MKGRSLRLMFLLDTVLVSCFYRKFLASPNSKRAKQTNAQTKLLYAAIELLIGWAGKS